MSRSARVGHVQLVGLDAVVLHLLRQQVLLGDRDLLVLGVAGQADHLHAVEQRRRDVHGVGRGDEHHVGQVVLDLDVVVDERVVLLRIEHLEQRRRRIAAEVLAHLVDFVEQEQRIAHADLGHVLQDLAGHRADVRAAMAADLGLVAHAAERHADELAAGRRAIDWPSEVLPTPGGPTRHRIGAFSLSTRCCTARYSTMRSFTFSRP